MASQTPATIEVLRPRKVSWHKRLLVRVLVVVLLVISISLTTWWWPRRTMIAVWYVNGTVLRNADGPRANQVVGWSNLIGVRWLGDTEEVERFLSRFSADTEITGVDLTKAKVSDEWLVRLKQFPKLDWIVLHDRQLGPGLEHLRDLNHLKGISVYSASNRHLVELKRLPELRSLMLWEPKSGDIGLDVLATLPNLKWFFISDCADLGELLQAVPDNARLERLGTQDCRRLTDDDLNSLRRLKNLKQLSIVRSGPIGDVGLIQISHVTTLETLVIRPSVGEITDRGLDALQSLHNLTYLGLPYNWTPEQLQSLQQALPKAKIDK